MNRKKRLPRVISRTASDMRLAGSGAAVVVEDPATGEPTTAAPTAVALPQADAKNLQRLFRARAIVERHGNMASFGGLIPLPLINVAGVTGIILRMTKLLCELYDVPYDQGRARAVAVSLAAGAIPSTAAVTASTIIYFVPGANLIGLAISSVTASVCTRTVGYRFIQHFESGADLLNFPVVERPRR